jgi:hypothetical protein
MHVSRHKSPRTLAGLSFIWLALISAGLLAVLDNQSGDISTLFEYGTPAYSMVLFTSASFVLAIICFNLFFLFICLPKGTYTAILVLSVIMAISCIKFAQVLLLGWIFPLWYVFRYTRAKNE